MNRTIFSLLLALCITQLQANSSQKEAMRRNFIYESKCLETENLTMDEVEAFAVHGKMEEADSKPQLKCLSACLLERSGYINNCKVHDEYFADNEDVKEFHDLLVTCKERVTAAERCECAYQLAKCVVEEKPEDF